MRAVRCFPKVTCKQSQYWRWAQEASLCLMPDVCIISKFLHVSHWRRKWQPTPVFMPGKSHGPRNLVGYSPWGRKESDMTERLHYYYFFPQVHRIPTSSFNVTLIVNMGLVRGSKYYASQSVLVVKSFLKKICLSSRHLSSISHTFL